ncbi:MAG TPA: chemotaxis response regulator protein-glutamate methylesterase [Synergistetes bacterium]|nr:chemotaxis response regulator protein-glutamate methylesterase [Synergistota bacterium]
MTPGGRIRVLVTDDSAFMRTVLGDIISAVPDMEVAGKARNGPDALEKIARLRPHVVTMDVEMPGMDGLQTLRSIMETSPLPVIMISGRTGHGTETTIRALESGAFDFIRKPSGQDPGELVQMAQELQDKIRLAFSSIAVLPGMEEVLQERVPGSVFSLPSGGFDLLLIAASTGGPQTLARLMPGFSSEFPAPVVIVQHMPKDFTRSFAERLDQISGLSVMEARDGMPLAPGVAVVAPGGVHLELEGKKGSIKCVLRDSPSRNYVKPSADVLFSSAARIPGVVSAGLILTGMGRDGTEGAKELRERGGFVIAESRETAVVYGMPRVAAESGAVDRVLPLHLMAGDLAEMFPPGGKK